MYPKNIEQARTGPIFFAPVQKYFRRIEGSGIGAETI